MKLSDFVVVLMVGLLGGTAGTFLSVAFILPAQLNAFMAQVPHDDGYSGNVSISINSTLQDRIFSILQENRDSVVYITVSKVTHTPFGDDVSQVSGSGFVISDRGFIVTNNHVVSDGSNITVVFRDGEEMLATLRGADPLNDVAVIKINPKSGLNPVEIGDSDSIKQGEVVLAIGSPFRLQNTVTLGIISGLNRSLVSERGYRIENVVQTDAAINPGNSGGPLLDLEGKVIGINTAIISQSGGSEGIGFAIPINKAGKIYNEIIETGKVARPWMGITGVDVTKNLAAMWNLTVDSGVIIIDFMDPSPAKEAGMRETVSQLGEEDFVVGDVIAEINGAAIRNNIDLLNALLKYKPGDEVVVKASRDGEYMNFSLKLGERPRGV